MPAHSKCGFATDPVPAEEALAGNDESLAVGHEDAQKLLAVAGDLLVEEGVSGHTEDADIEATGVEADAAGVNMLFRVESHRVPFMA